MSMSKTNFLNRAKGLAALVTKERNEKRAAEAVLREPNRKEHLAEVSKYDTEAAKLEQAFFAASAAATDAELAVARHYASKLEE